MNVNPSTTVTKSMSNAPNTAESAFKKLLNAKTPIIMAVKIIEEIYIITVKYFESLSALMVTFLVRKAKITATS